METAILEAEEKSMKIDQVRNPKLAQSFRGKNHFSLSQWTLK